LFQTLPRGEGLAHAIEPMVMEGLSRETRHRHRFIGLASRLTSGTLGQIHRASARIDVQVTCGF
jgi:hypothetical protein